ncbi:MAG: F0F1 ATP synthase subunit B' [Alphaproteobacteria bacterium]|jgi:F-type H+-transporting ATPase subunit b|nr:F0F1 ATP synthase subunit B' [Alphaproteobacteria bacterium]MBT7942035.1 F0F1 ATP synthase subunit B' [Alphaproteobacteria bacterium]
MPQIEDVASFLPQIFWLVITFTALFLIMWKIAVPGIADVLEARQKRISDNLDKATQAKQEAEETLGAYETSMAEARGEAQALNAQATKQCADESEARETEMAEQLGQSFTKSEADIQAAIDAAMGNVRDIAIEVAADALQRLSGQAADDKTLADTVDRVLKAQG